MVSGCHAPGKQSPALGQPRLFPTPACLVDPGHLALCFSAGRILGSRWEGCPPLGTSLGLCRAGLLGNSLWGQPGVCSPLSRRTKGVQGAGTTVNKNCSAEENNIKPPFPSLWLFKLSFIHPFIHQIFIVYRPRASLIQHKDPTL